MLLKYSFIPVITCLLGALAWWSLQVGVYPLDPALIGPQSKVENPSLVSHRRELVETLDKVIAYEHYYHSVYGHFTKLVNKTGYTIPQSIMNIYDIRVAEASQDRILVTAISEVDGKVLDVASIDQDFQVHSNFRLPSPRSTYLKAHAKKHMRMIQTASEGHVLEEEGVYKGYFKYSVRGDSKNGKTAFAVGVKPPVVGVQLEFNDSDSLEEELLALNGEESGTHLGQKGEGDVSSLDDQTYLAQKIFHGEMGRYAKTWTELSKIAHFKFEGKDQKESASEGPKAGEQSSSNPRGLASDEDPPASWGITPGGLVIEAISPGK
jgi:hypothetical protein